MATERVGDMTIKELKDLIHTTVEQHLGRGVWPPVVRNRSVAEVWESMLKNISKPTADEPSALELLRQERDQWYSNT